MGDQILEIEADFPGYGDARQAAQQHRRTQNQNPSQNSSRNPSRILGNTGRTDASAVSSRSASRASVNNDAVMNIKLLQRIAQLEAKVNNLESHTGTFETPDMGII